jgi:hypothetical protein
VLGLVEVAIGTVVVARYVVEVSVVKLVDVAVVVVAYVVDVAVVVVVACAGPNAGAFVGTRTTSATRIMQTITRILIASCLLKTVLSTCWV